MNFRRLIAPVALTLGFTPLALVAPPPAYAAAPTVLTVCNSVDSSGGRINVWRLGPSTAGSPWLGYGDCWPIYNGDGNARVQVERGDYKIKTIIPAGSYGPCHNGPRYNSDPPNVTRVVYRTKPITYC